MARLENSPILSVMINDLLHLDTLGMLSAWARIKYPNVFDMALAASAPIPQAVNLLDTGLFHCCFRLHGLDVSKTDPILTKQINTDKVR